MYAGLESCEHMAKSALAGSRGFSLSRVLKNFMMTLIVATLIPISMTSDIYSLGVSSHVRQHMFYE